jgi:hypothetical protein
MTAAALEAEVDEYLVSFVDGSMRTATGLWFATVARPSGR